MTTGELIKRARKKSGLTQKQLGEKIGVSGAMIGQYETGIRNPKKEMLVKIAKQLGVRWYELYSDDAKEQAEEIKRIIKEGINSNDQSSSEFINLLSNPAVFDLGLMVVERNQIIRKYKESENGNHHRELSENEKEVDAVFQVVNVLLKNKIYPSRYQDLIDFGFSEGEAFVIMSASESGILSEDLPEDRQIIEENIYFELNKSHFQDNKEG